LRFHHLGKSLCQRQLQHLKRSQESSKGEMRDHAYSAATLTPISPILVIFSSAGKFSIL
jgi:hypothetical protein